VLKIYFLNSHDTAATVDRSTDKELAGMFNIFRQLTANKSEAIDADAIRVVAAVHAMLVTRLILQEHTIALELFWARKFTANYKALLLNTCE